MIFILYRLIVKTLTVCVRATGLKTVLQQHPECPSSQFVMGDTRTFIELSRLGGVKYMPDVLGNCNVLLESACHSRSSERNFRFGMNCCELKRHYLQKYGLGEGPEAVRLELIRKR